MAVCEVFQDSLRRSSMSGKRFNIYWADGWGYESDGEILDEPTGGAVKLCDTDNPTAAAALLDAWPTLAAHRYGRGVVVLLDDNGQRCGEVKQARPPGRLAAG